MSKTNLAIDWHNIDLNSVYERDLHLVEPLTFTALLLEINCNIPNINAVTIREQFAQDLQSRVDEAWEVFDANMVNIEQQARKERDE